MDPINPLDRLTALLRKRLDGKRPAKGKAHDSGQAAPRAAAQNMSTDALRQKIRKSIETIDPDDPGRDRKAARVFVTDVLVWQFGDALLNDAGFADLVDEVQAALEQDPGFHESLMASFAASGKPR